LGKVTRCWDEPFGKNLRKIRWLSGLNAVFWSNITEKAAFSAQNRRIVEASRQFEPEKNGFS
jgi:hypothetical protein